MESGISHSTEYFWVNNKNEVHLNTGTHSFLIGKSKDLESAKKLIEKLEKYPKNLKYLIPRENWYHIELLFK
jgi:hypothetical protein